METLVLVVVFASAIFVALLAFGEIEGYSDPSVPYRAGDGWVEKKQTVHTCHPPDSHEFVITRKKKWVTGDVWRCNCGIIYEVSSFFGDMWWRPIKRD